MEEYGIGDEGVEVVLVRHLSLGVQKLLGDTDVHLRGRGCG